MKATFGPSEESPEYAVQQISFLARREVNLLMTTHGDVSYGEGDPLKRCAEAEQELLQARELAAGFGQDVQPIEAKLAWVRQTRKSRNQSAAAAAPWPRPRPCRRPRPGAQADRRKAWPSWTWPAAN